MVRKRDGLVPIGEAFSDLGGPVKEIRDASPQAVHHFTRFDQVNQLVEASEADPDLGFMARLMALCSAAPHQPRRPLAVYPSERPVQADYDFRRRHQAPLRQPAAPLAGLGLH